MRLKVSMMIPVAVLMGVSSIYAGRNWLDRQMQGRLQEMEAQNKARPAVQQQTFGTIVVAAEPLRFGSEITKAQLREIPWPQGQTPKGSFAKIDEFLAEKGKRVALSALESNEPVLSSKVTGPGQRANLAAVIEDDKKAVTVRVDDVVGVGGFVLPNDRVDVLLTRKGATGDAMSDVILQNLKVLAIDQTIDERTSKPTIARAVTLEVETKQAQRLIVAQSVGLLTLVLRPIGQNGSEANQRVNSTELGSFAPASKEKAPAGTANIMVGVIRNSGRQEYSVPARGE